MKITGGIGGVKQCWESTKGATKDAIKVFAKEEGKVVLKGGGLAVVFAVAMDIAEWYQDYSEVGVDGKPKKDFMDLFTKVGTDLVKAGIVAALTTAVMTVGLTILTITGLVTAAPVIAIAVGTVIVSVLITFLVEKIDKAIAKHVGEESTTAWISKKFKSAAEYLSKISKDVRYDEYPMLF